MKTVIKLVLIIVVIIIIVFNLAAAGRNGMERRESPVTDSPCRRG